MAKKFYIIDGHENKNHHKLDLAGVSDEDKVVIFHKIR